MIAFWKGHSVARYVRSLAPLTRSALLCSLRLLAPFTGLLTHFTHSLVGQLKFLNMCSLCFTGTNAFLALIRNTPLHLKMFTSLLCVIYGLNNQQVMLSHNILEDGWELRRVWNSHPHIPYPTCFTLCGNATRPMNTKKTKYYRLTNRQQGRTQKWTLGQSWF